MRENRSTFYLDKIFIDTYSMYYLFDKNSL